MSDSVAQRLQRLEAKLDEIGSIVYELKGELKGWKQLVVFLAGIISLLISVAFNIVVGR